MQAATGAKGGPPVLLNMRWKNTSLHTALTDAHYRVHLVERDLGGDVVMPALGLAMQIAHVCNNCTIPSSANKSTHPLGQSDDPTGRSPELVHTSPKNISESTPMTDTQTTQRTAGFVARCMWSSRNFRYTCALIVRRASWCSGELSNDIDEKEDNDFDDEEETPDAALVRALQTCLPPKVQTLIVNHVSEIPPALATLAQVLTPSRVSAGAAMLKAAKEARMGDVDARLDAITLLLESGDKVGAQAAFESAGQNRLAGLLSLDNAELRGFTPLSSVDVDALDSAASERLRLKESVHFAAVNQ